MDRFKLSNCSYCKMYVWWYLLLFEINRCIDIIHFHQLHVHMSSCRPRHDSRCRVCRAFQRFLLQKITRKVCFQQLMGSESESTAACQPVTGSAVWSLTPSVHMFLGVVFLQTHGLNSAWHMWCTVPSVSLFLGIWKCKCPRTFCCSFVLSGL